MLCASSLSSHFFSFFFCAFSSVVRAFPIVPRHFATTHATSRSHLYVVIPFYSGGDLLKRVVPNQGTGETKAVTWFRQILLGLAYVHSKVRAGSQACKQTTRQPGNQATRLPGRQPGRRSDRQATFPSRGSAKKVVVLAFSSCACFIFVFNKFRLYNCYRQVTLFFVYFLLLGRVFVTTTSAPKT